MKVCPGCGSKNNDVAKFCVDCGAPMLQINGTSKVITIGRGAGNSVVLNNPAVSNFHCELVIKNGVVVVTDKNSSNGVFVNGVRITTKALKKGDVVTLGSKFVFNGKIIPPEGQAHRQFLILPPTGNLNISLGEIHHVIARSTTSR